jgi:hypothetical protein
LFDKTRLNTFTRQRIFNENHLPFSSLQHPVPSRSTDSISSVETGIASDGNFLSICPSPSSQIQRPSQALKEISSTENRSGSPYAQTTLPDFSIALWYLSPE